MGISNLGLSFNLSGEDSGPNIKIYASEKSPRNIYLKWHTDCGTEWHGAFDIALRARTVSKGVSGTGSDYGAWSDVYYQRIPSSSCNPNQTRNWSGWWWGHDLDVAGAFAALTNGGSFSFDARKHDAINLDVGMKAVYANGIVDGLGRPYSSRVDFDAYIEYIPQYTIKSIYYETISRVVVEYDPGGWTRTDDRWAIESVSQNGKSIMPESTVWGYASKAGRIELPVSSFASIPRHGEPLSVDIRMNAAHRVSGAVFANIVGTKTLENRAVCNKPSLLISVDDDNACVNIEVSDAGNLAIPFESAMVKMQGGEYQFDTKRALPGETVKFRFPPIGKTLTFEAIGSVGSEKLSDVVTSSNRVVVGRGGFVVGEVASDLSVSLMYNLDFSAATDRASAFTKTKLSGRTRESVYYGVGASSSLSLSCSVLENDDGNTLGSIKRIGESSNVVVRGPDGSRYLAAVDNVSVSKKGPSVTAVSLSMTEVS